MLCLAERCRMVDVRNIFGVQSDPPARCPEAWKNLPFVDNSIGLTTACCSGTLQSRRFQFPCGDGDLSTKWAWCFESDDNIEA